MKTKRLYNPFRTFRHTCTGLLETTKINVNVCHGRKTETKNCTKETDTYVKWYLESERYVNQNQGRTTIKKEGDIRVPSKDLTMPMCVPLARPPMHTQTNIHMYIAEVYLLQCSSNVAPLSPGLVPCTLCISPSFLPHDSLSAFLHARFVPLFHPLPFSTLSALCILVFFHWSAFIRYLSHVPPSLTLFFSPQQRPKMDSLPGPE